MASKPSFFNGRQWTLVLGLFAALALIVFHQVLVPGQVLFSNDGPVGQLMSACHQLPQRFAGCWEDLDIVGYRESAALPNISFFLQWLLKPVLFSKLYAPTAVVILGLSAWAFFRELKLTAPACILGGLAAMLNSAFFSVACWGIAAHTLAIAMTFLALAALVSTAAPRRWLRVVIAGFCVGMGVTEGADVGALCSIFVVLFVIYQVCITEGSRVKHAFAGVGRVVLIAVCAALVAASAVSELVSNNIKDISGTQQDAKTRAEHWNWATQWSLPKREALGIIVPGLFGYRLDSTDGSQYWGAIGQAVEWRDYFANGSQGAGPDDKYKRNSGTGYYPGTLVMMLALWAVLQSLRTPSLFDSGQRKWIWFWAAVIVVSLLLAFGRYAPLYRFLYALPYFSTIRNPIKFLYFVSMAVVALFAFGMDGLWRGFVNKSEAEQKRTKPGRFENLWLPGSFIFLALIFIAWAIYAGHQEKLEEYLQSVQFDAAAAHLIAMFSFGQVKLFIFCLAVSTVLVNLALRRYFTNKSASWFVGIFGLFLVIDLGLANQPWITFLDYRNENATNPILDSLRENSYEHRVALVPLKGPAGPTTMEQIYHGDWQLHQFPFYNIQSFDTSQLTRAPVDLTAFSMRFGTLPEVFVRKWQLTNTRYLLGSVGMQAFMNDSLDPVLHRFRIATRFSFVPRPGVFAVNKVWDLTAVPDVNGQFAVFEFTGALPRARLYSQWEVNSNAPAVLEQIASPGFDPEKTVMVAGVIPAPSSNPAQAAGTVAFENYAPKRIQLKAEAAAPAVLLLNDRFDSNWRVYVDGRPETLLRCNYLMRGVYLASAGSHTVEFRFEPSTWPLSVSLAAVFVGLFLVGFVFVGPKSAKNPKPQEHSPKNVHAATSVTSK